VLETAEGVLKHPAGAARSHANTAACLASSLPIGRAVQSILGIPKWQELVRPLLLACLVRCSASVNSTHLYLTCL
jgi:hypothetical protein